MAIPVIGQAVAWAMNKMFWPIVVRVAFALGITMTAYVGMDTLLENLKVQVWNSLGGSIGDAIDLAYLAGLDQVITIVFSAITMRLAVSGIKSGAQSVMGFRTPGG